MQYELAYHITPDMEETTVKTRAQDLETTLVQSGASIVASREPKKIHLSYPLSHKHYGFFGVIEFNAEPEAIAPMQTQMKLQEGILRFMIVKKPTEGKEIRTLGDQRNRRSRIQVAPTHKPTATEPAKPKSEEKVIEKELEDVLGKI